VNLERGADLVNLENLDQKLWTALSCPVYGLEIDSKTLELIDTDNDGRIRVPEILAAVKWLVSMVKNPDMLLKEEQFLKLDDINIQSEEGSTLLISAKQILNNLGKSDSNTISVDDTSDTVKIFADTRFNGDGIITDISIDDEGIKKLIGEIVSSVGFVVDRTGKEGISADHINDFYKACEEYSAWIAIAKSKSKKILPFGNDTSAALDSFLSVRGKIEDYFLRCKLLSYDQNSVETLNFLKSKYESISLTNLSVSIDELTVFPIALPNCNNLLSLKQGLNPAWEKSVSTFDSLVVQKLFPDKLSLSEEDMLSIEKVFEEFIVWQSEKKGLTVEALGVERIYEIVAGQDQKEVLESLILEDKALEGNANNIMLVDQLVRYRRDLFKLLRNYVIFYDFYSPEAKAIFQSGQLYFDQRRCDLCMKVTDMSKHNQLAATSGLCLIYCDCTRVEGNSKMTIVAALTDGDFDNIDVGRNGVFYDRDGNDWDATIVKVIDNPISIRQAFWSPYRKFTKFINKQMEKIASDKEKAVDTSLSSGVEKVSDKVDVGLNESVKSAPVQVQTPLPAAAPQSFDIGKFVGIFAAISLALGALGSALTSIFMGFFSLSWWKMPIAILGIMLVISGPSMIIAWLKLRKRNLAPLLDANGWAVNARTSINIAFGATLTHLAALPKNSKLNLSDPFSKKKFPWKTIIFIILILAVAAFVLWHFGLLDGLFNPLKTVIDKLF
jgi:hypothetical protein